MDFKTDLCVGGMVSPPPPPPGCMLRCSRRHSYIVVGHAGLLQKESLGLGLEGGSGCRVGLRGWGLGVGLGVRVVDHRHLREVGVVELGGEAHLVRAMVRITVRVRVGV